MKIKVSREERGKRLDTYLSSCLSYSRSFIKEMIKAGYVRIDGLVVKPSAKIKEEEEIGINLPEPEPLLLEPEDIPLEIFYEDSEIIVVNKRPGMVVHPATSHRKGTLVNALLSLGSLSQMGAPLRPGIVHRLDKDTSGILVAARTNQAYWNLVAQFKERKVKRIYFALAWGIVKKSSGEIVAPIGRCRSDRKKMAVTAGKEATTFYEVLARYLPRELNPVPFTALRVTLGTGRTHQIRVHLSHLEHPVVGDQKYGGNRKDCPLKRQALHAYYLGFTHPKTGEFLEFKTDWPQDIKDFLATKI
ncbi:RluA family pseudouridine synthase [bacterium]|nr:RluA family pseudouridine synthase [bacterium]MBU1615366.1 RluA family pseudouridine synthase [bacterium]